MIRWGVFFSALATPFRALLNPEGQKAWAILLMAGCAIAMTAYVIWVLWIVKDRPQYAFYLGAAGFVMIAIVTTGFASLIVKRDIDLHALGLQLKISDQQAQQIADKVVAATPPPPPAAAQPPAAVIVQTGAPTP